MNATCLCFVGWHLLCQFAFVRHSLYVRHMKQSFSWTVKCDICSWEMRGYSVKSFAEDEANRHKANGCITEKENNG